MNSSPILCVFIHVDINCIIRLFFTTYIKSVISLTTRWTRQSQNSSRQTNINHSPLLQGQSHKDTSSMLTLTPSQTIHQQRTSPQSRQDWPHSADPLWRCLKFLAYVSGLMANHKGSQLINRFIGGLNLIPEWWVTSGPGEYQRYVWTQVSSFGLLIWCDTFKSGPLLLFSLNGGWGTVPTRCIGLLENLSWLVKLDEKRTVVCCGIKVSLKS